MAIYIDIPQIAYRTWTLEYNTGDRARDYELERDLEQKLKDYAYSVDHDHVR